MSALLQAKSMDSRIEKGHPGLWKLHEQVASHGEELAKHKDNLGEHARQISDLFQSQEEVNSQIFHQKEMTKLVEEEIKELNGKVVGGAVKL